MRSRALLSLLCLAIVHARGAMDAPELAALGVGDIRRAVVADAPAGRWETAFVSGNGQQGVMVMGRPLNETLILNTAGLFLPLTAPISPPSQGAHLAEIRGLLAQEKYQAAAELVVSIGEKDGYNGTHWNDPFVPACSLQLQLKPHGEVRDYARSTDYPTGVVGTRWADDRGVIIRRVFVSRADNVTVLSLHATDGAPLDLDLGFTQHDPSTANDNARDRPDPAHFSAVESASENAALFFHTRFSRAWPGSIQGAEAAARVIARDGTIQAQGDGVQVRGASEILVLIRTALIRDYAARDPSALARDLELIEPDYDKLLARHVALHGGIFNRARFELAHADPADHRLPAARLFAKSKIGATSPALLEKQFDACRYLILSSSGPAFMPTLQGIWGGTFSPPWSSGFTHDGNLPVAVIGNLPGNMPEALEGYFAYHEAHLASYRANARALFDARGLVVPAHSSSHGFANHFGPRWCLTFWSAGAAWVAHTYYDYWLHTGDREFLLERALPFMKETALFYEDFLAGTETPDGRVHFAPSYSPENDPANTGSQATVDATMDSAACRELLRNLIAICERERIEADMLPRWRALLEKLPPYRINEDGAVAEWTDVKLRDNYAHRHVSHLYELYDGLPAHIASDPALMQAFRVALQKRTDWRRQIGGGEMAFGQAQMGAVAASLRMPDLAYENIEMLANWFWFPESMMTAHNPQSLFNTDIAGGIPQLIIKMLVDSQPGTITLLPALPPQWPAGALTGTLARGQIEIRRLEWDGEQVAATLISAIDQTVRLDLHNTPDARLVPLKAGEATTVVFKRR